MTDFGRIYYNLCCIAKVAHNNFFCVVNREDGGKEIKITLPPHVETIVFNKEGNIVE